MWIDMNHPHPWEVGCLAGQMLGLDRTIGVGPPVERFGKTHPQVYPQKEPLSSPIHILEKAEIPAHIWGEEFGEIFSLFWNCPQRRSLIHKLSRVIHRLRPSSAVMRDFPTP